MRTKRKGIIAFLGLTFGGAWILWEIPFRFGIEFDNPLFQIAAIPGAFAPAVAAVVVRKWITREGFGDAELRLNLKKWRYYLVAWLLPLPVTAVIIGLAMTFRVSQPDFSFMRFATWLMGESPPEPPSNLLFILPFQLLVSSLIGTPLSWGEEFGWRGYLQRRLFSDRPLIAAVATGIIWAVWHFPINLRGYNFPDRPLLGMIVFPISLIFLSIIFGWLRSKTGSIWAPSLAHSAGNSIGATIMVLLFIGGPNWIFLSYLGILSWIPLGILSLWIVLSGQIRPDPR
jgi:membrane protease YdiL (CAAX protease family)